MRSLIRWSLLRSKLFHFPTQKPACEQAFPLREGLFDVVLCLPKRYRHRPVGQSGTCPTCHLAASTAVTCSPFDAHGYWFHLPQNLGDGGWIWSRGSPYPTLHNFPASHNLSCCPAIYNHLRGTYETPR